MISDPRLPDVALASRRVYGDMRPRVNVPGRATVWTSRQLGHLRYRVYANRTRRRWWLEVLANPANTKYGGTLVDYATTTSEQVARGWCDAINEMAANKGATTK